MAHPRPSPETRENDPGSDNLIQPITQIWLRSSALRGSRAAPWHAGPRKERSARPVETLRLSQRLAATTVVRAKVYCAAEAVADDLPSCGRIAPRCRPPRQSRLGDLWRSGPLGKRSRSQRHTKCQRPLGSGGPSATPPDSYSALTCGSQTCSDCLRRDRRASKQELSSRER